MRKKVSTGRREGLAPAEISACPARNGTTDRRERIDIALSGEFVRFHSNGRRNLAASAAILQQINCQWYYPNAGVCLG